MDTTWGKLAKEHAGRTITVTVPWQTEPITARFLRTGEVRSWEPDGTERPIHHLEYADQGEQATMLRADTPVQVT